MISELRYNVSEFIIQGFTNIPELQAPTFGIFLCIYFLIMFGNLNIIFIIWTSSQLHTPMYIFLVNLSIIDIASTSNILPNLLVILCTKKKTISFVGCITQMYVFVSLSCVEVILLAVMAYDRYVAICHPLHYFVLMPLRQSAVFSFISWFVGFLDPIGHAVLISNLSFCSNKYIDHFFCDMTPLLKIACTDTSNVNMLNYVEGTLIAITAFMLTVISYIFIISVILRIKSTEGQRKAFSTCAAHLTCVCIFYGTILCIYMRPTSTFSTKQNKYFSLLYIVFVPMLNPVIYSLKNEDVKKVLLGIKQKYFLILKRFIVVSCSAVFKTFISLNLLNQLAILTQST